MRETIDLEVLGDIQEGFFLDMTGEVTGSGEGTAVLRTRMTSLTQVDSLDMLGKVTGLAECFLAELTVLALLTQVDSFDMKGKVAGLAECTHRCLPTEVFLVLDYQTPLWAGVNIRGACLRHSPCFLASVLI